MVDQHVKTADLLRLQAWLSPTFPIGGFSYSHGLEEAVALGDVDDPESLFGWIEAAVSQGAGRVDGMLLVAAWQPKGGRCWIVATWGPHVCLARHL